MIRLRHKLLIRAFLLLDQLVLIATSIGIIYYRPDLINEKIGYPLEAKFGFETVIVMAIIAVGWIIIFNSFIRYKADRLVALNNQLINLVKATSISSIWLMIAGTIFSLDGFNFHNILIFFGVVTAIGVATRLFLRAALLSARRSGYNTRYLLVVGASDRAYQLATKIQGNQELGFKIVGFVAETSDVMEQWKLREPCNWEVLGLLDNLRHILIRARVDEIMVCLSLETSLSDLAKIVGYARDLGIVARLMSNTENAILLNNLYVEELDDECVVTLFREQMLVQVLVKRLIDVTLSIFVLILLSPLLAVVAILIKLSSRGPVLFVQKRVGMNQRQFKLYKFRSMIAGAEQLQSAIAHLNEQDGPAFKIEKDPRTTRLGRFLRKTSIDELPQLLNVLIGEMSLVGPRPPLPEEVKNYAWRFRKRLSVKPGMSCIWQISGRNHVSFDRWMEMDHEYIANWSLWLDLKILLLTIPVVLFSRGAS
jgi:exopolysaccharide biosynthesis polyprenyl glycosylphosphotransferase